MIKTILFFLGVCMSVCSFAQKKQLIGKWILQEVTAEVKTDNAEIKQWIDSWTADENDPTSKIEEYTKEGKFIQFRFADANYWCSQRSLTLRRDSEEEVYSYHLSNDSLFLERNMTNLYADVFKKAALAGNVEKVIQKKLYIRLYELSEVDTQPLFPGGENAFVKFQGENLIYPEGAEDTEITIPVIVDKSGKMSNNTEERTHDGISFGGLPLGAYNEPARDMVSLMPDWIPATKNGKSVSVSYRLPVKYEVK